MIEFWGATWKYFLPMERFFTNSASLNYISGQRLLIRIGTARVQSGQIQHWHHGCDGWGRNTSGLLIVLRLPRVFGRNHLAGSQPSNSR
jgi:hypothetical protein